MFWYSSFIAHAIFSINFDAKCIHYCTNGVDSCYLVCFAMSGE